MSMDREIIRMIVLEEHAEEFEKLKKETEKLKTKLKLLKQYDLPPDVEQIIDRLLEI